jgi:proteasome assembly chaperone (PAC2) family protein
VTLYRLEEPVDGLTAPVVIAAFDGWIDAAGAATTATAHLADDGQVIATFDGDALFDFRSRRPTLDIVDGTLSELGWPELTLTRNTVGGRDLLVLMGAEPDLRWRELATSILDLCLRLGVVEWVSLGTIPAAVPHTRPVPVLATASAPGLLRHEVTQGPEGLLRVPAAALSTIELAVSGSGIPAVGFYGQVPHYVGGPYAAASVALLEHLARHLGVDIDPGDLSSQAVEQRQRLDAAAASDEDTQQYIARLEAIVGEERIPSGDELASEIERFLREQGERGERRGD